MLNQRFRAFSHEIGGDSLKTTSIQADTDSRGCEKAPANFSKTKMHILDAEEAAALIKMDSRTLLRWARLGYVPAHPLGEGKRRLWRFIEDELLEWFENRSYERKLPARSMESAIGARARRSA